MDFKEKAEILKEYEHLCEYQVKPANLGVGSNFARRDGFVAGQLMIGDLIINEEATKNLEVHPFPEWVAQLIRIDTPKDQASGYAVVLNINQKDFKRIEKKDWRDRKDAFKELTKDCKPESLVAFRLVPGICVKIPGSVPHYFVSGKKTEGTEYPYCQVYEPEINWNTFAPFGKFEATMYFQVPFEIRI
nr:hypothetical protein [Candidatus Sigynarchaeota archaeon]